MTQTTGIGSVAEDERADMRALDSITQEAF